MMDPTRPYVAATSSVVELIPAIVLGLEGPDIPSLPDPWSERAMAEWQRQKRQALGLDPERPIDGLIALDEVLGDRLLNAVADYVIECGEEYGWSPFLDGGLVLVVDGRVFSRPTCCVDLEEGVRDWVRLAEDWPSSWDGVESGHPGVLARWSDGRIHITDQLDDFPGDIGTAVDIGLDQLQAALPAAHAAIASFAERLEGVLVARQVPEAKHRARVVAGLDKPA